MQNPTHGEKGKDVMYKTNSSSPPGSSTPSPRCHLQRTISLSSTSSCSSPHSYIYHDLNPWPSSPCDLEELQEEEDEFLVPNEDLLRPADYRDKGKGTNGSFLRRRMWQNPSSPPSVSDTAPDLLPGDGEEEGGKPRRTRSGSLLRRLRSASQSSSVQVPPSIKITIPESELPKKQDCCTVQVYPVTDEESDFIAAHEPEQPLAMSPDYYYSAATGRRDSTLLAQLRAADLQWRTRVYRVKSRISTSQRNVSMWMDEKFGNMARNSQ
ncbi:hypothetical protein PHLCEN_2v7759 [Hermanssonia centrifuga]|uniref:Uncharacterized protein n=1 Tax=Hermanssonia centrifuga TaxID=98765 RepID=A0A2R6NVZ9_9APHY|nr:hypothetical protein PHLCEN_2v7759 [Hermanssonia centrifuga]